MLQKIMKNKIGLSQNLHTLSLGLLSTWLREVTHLQGLLQPISLIQFDVVVDFLRSELTHEVHVQLNDPRVNVHLFVDVYSTATRIPVYQVKEPNMFILQSINHIKEV